MKNVTKKPNLFFLLTIIPLLFIASELWFIIYIGLPYLKHENALKTPEVLCLKLDVSHGCDTEHFENDALEKYLKEEVLTRISIEEVEDIVYNTQDQNKKTEQECKANGQCEEYTLRYIERIKKYYTKMIPVIQKIKQE